jgi:hypothetical protein
MCGSPSEDAAELLQMELDEHGGELQVELPRRPSRRGRTRTT